VTPISPHHVCNCVFFPPLFWSRRQPDLFFFLPPPFYWHVVRPGGTRFFLLAPIFFFFFFLFFLPYEVLIVGEGTAGNQCCPSVPLCPPPSIPNPFFFSSFPRCQNLARIGDGPVPWSPPFPFPLFPFLERKNDDLWEQGLRLSFPPSQVDSPPFEDKIFTVRRPKAQLLFFSPLPFSPLQKKENRVKGEELAQVLFLPAADGLSPQENPDLGGGDSAVEAPPFLFPLRSSSPNRKMDQSHHGAPFLRIDPSSLKSRHFQLRSRGVSSTPFFFLND